MTFPKKPNVYSLNSIQWLDFVAQNGQPKFRVQQILEALFLKGALSPEAIPGLPQPLRTALGEQLDWTQPIADTILPSSDGSEKILLKMPDGRFVESVLMPSYEKDQDPEEVRKISRVTLCVSSQVGCRMACSFCQTGKMGFGRQLSMGEILFQVTFANQRLRETHEAGPDGCQRTVSHVVFMGMGEPLDNYENVVQACRAFIDPKMFGLSKHKVTVSTSGLVPEILRLGADVPVALAISLHSACETKRTEMMPVNKRYPLVELKKALLQYPIQTRHGITFEYVMIRGINDSLQDAKKLVSFLHGLKAKVNLIPMNTHPGNPMESSSTEALLSFQKYLSAKHIPSPIRYSRGQDISAACGQLAAKRQDEIALPPRQVALARQRERRQVTYQ